MISTVLQPRLAALAEFRQDIHRHPELSNEEFRTTDRLVAALQEAGLRPRRFEGTGLMVDVGEGDIALALRADIDALPVDDLTATPFSSEKRGVCHACGHDIHLSGLLGAALVLADIDRERPLGARVRFIFQPAEEVTPGGAIRVIREGALDGVPRVFALHCDPNVDVGKVGSRIGAITAAGDTVVIDVSGHGGHTSRPHLTQDLVYALAQVAAQVPAALSRLIDPRHAVSLVWGAISAGHAPNVVPSEGRLTGTLRCLDVDGWHMAAEVLPDIVNQIAGPYGVEVTLDHRRGVPPVVNTENEVSLAETAIRKELGAGSVELTPQSMGGEDFAWYLTTTPGAMVRLGTRTPDGVTYDIHQGDLLVDERALEMAVRVFVSVALETIGTGVPSGVVAESQTV